MATMSKVDMLWVRACKSYRPEQRLESVYRRFYVRGKLKPHDLCQILYGVCERTHPMTAKPFINNMALAFLDKEKTYWDVVSQIIISHIRFSERTAWDDGGIIWSTKWIKD